MARTREDPRSPHAAETSTFKTVQRLVVVLSSFTVRHPRLSLNELTKELGVSKATTHRYTKALRAANLLHYDERTMLFSLGSQLLTIATVARAGMPIIRISEPTMSALMHEVDQTVALSMWDGESASVVSCADDTDHVIRVRVRTGARLDLFASAQGQIFCAFLPEDEVPGLSSQLRKSPELRQNLEAIRVHGVTVNSSGVSGVRTIAAPIFDGARVVAAMAIVGTESSISTRLDSPMAQALLEATRDLSTKMAEASRFEGAHASASR